jgi:hypothetical protein
MTFAEQNGIWHAVHSSHARFVETLCGPTIEDASILERDDPPKPLCAQCGETTDPAIAASCH